MKLKGIHYLAGLVLLLAVVTFFDFSQENSKKQSEEKNLQLFQLNLDQLSKVEIQNPKEQIEIVKTVDGWKMMKPVEDWCDSEKFEELLKSIYQEKAQSLVKSGDSIDWGSYGLKEPKSIWTFSDHQNHKELLKISEKKNFEGQVYLQKNDEQKLYLGGATWMNTAGKSSTELRDHRFLRHKISSVVGIDILNGTEKIKASRETNLWKNDLHPKNVWDQNRIREFLTEVSQTQAMDFMYMGEIKDSQKLKEWGLLNPTMKIKLQLNDKSWIAELSKDKQNFVYARISEPSMVLKMEPGQTEKFFNLKEDAWRDKKIPFDFDYKKAQKIKIQTGLKSNSLIKENEKWSLEGDSKLSIDFEKIDKFLKNLYEIKNFEYSPSSALKSEHQISVLDKDNKIIFHLEWGNAHKVKMGAIEKDMFSARTNLAVENLEIEAASLYGLGLENLYKSEKSTDNLNTDIHK